MAWLYEIGVGKYFTQAQMEHNASEFYSYFHAYGATLESICGMLGNIQQESTINPGIKQGASTSLGWGLIQWTPSSVLTEWCDTYGYTWYDGNAQCDRIVAEGEAIKGAGGTWLPTSEYPYSWNEFIALTNVNEATYAYLKERERAGTEMIENRLKYANAWYTYLSGKPTPTPTPTPTKKKKMPIYMMIRRI